MAFQNTFHSSNWKLTLSNVPFLPNVAELKYFDNYAKSVIVPDYNLVEYFSDGPEGERERHPSSRKNEDLSQIQIEFKLSEELKNYLYLMQWMLSMRYGQVDPKRQDTRLWQSIIDRITIHLLDNQKREVAQLYFTQARLLNLSSISLDSGTDEEQIFTTNYSYREVGFEFIDVGS